MTTIHVTVNDVLYERTVEPRVLLSDFLRHDLGLHGTHVACEHGVCGACTILLDGSAVRSCLLFAVQVEDCALTTIEGISPDGTLGPLQRAFQEHHALQCGFCTAGIIVATTAFLREQPDPDDEAIREHLSAHLCRCTGYHAMVTAIRSVSSTG